MSIISSKHRLVKVNGTEYSAGSGIDITNNIISLDPNLSAVIDDKLDTSTFSSYSATIDDELQYVSANAGNTYSAGDNIDIYEQDNDLYISAKDWTTDIVNASSYAFNEATAQIPPAFDPTYISGQIDNKLNKSDFDTYSGSVNTQISGLSGEFQTTSSVLNNQITAVRNDLNTVSTNTGYLYNDLQTTSGILSGAIDYVSANVGDEFPASANEAITAYQTYSGTYLTAHQDISNKLDTTAFSTVSGTFLTAHQDLSNYATTGDLNNASSTLSGAIDYVSGNIPEGFTGVNHDNNLSGDGKSTSLGLASSLQLVDPSIYTTAIYNGGGVNVEGIMPRIQLKTNNSSYNTLGEGGMTVTHPASSVGGGYTTSHYGEKMSLSYNDGDYYLHTMDSTKSGLGVTYKGTPNVKAYYNYSGVALTNDNGATNEYVNVDSIRNWNGVYDTVESNSASWSGGAATLPITGADPSHTSAYYGTTELYFKVDDREGEPDIRYLSIMPGAIYLNATFDEENYFGFTLADDHLTLTSQNDPTCIGDVYAESISSWNDTYSTVQSNSANWGGTSLTGDAQGAVDEVYSNSADWNSNYSTVNSNSSTWTNGGFTGEVYGISGVSPNVDVYIDQNTLWISAAGGGAGNPEVESYVQTNSANINEVVSTYETNSGTYLTAHQDISNKLDTTAFSTVSGTFLTAHQDISANEWNSVYDTVEANSGSWTGGGGGSIDTIPVVAISPLVTGFSGESAYLGIESTALNLSSYVPVSSIGYNGSYISTISGYTISSYTGRYAMTANYANTANRAYGDRNGNEITSYYQPKLTIAGDAGTITSINGSAVGATIPEGWELVGSAGISIVDDSENNQTIISVTGGGGDLSNYYTKTETSSKIELDNAIGNIETLLANL